jgi:ubiquinone/menaquinone biosynthesis C-methylase UbiE
MTADATHFQPFPAGSKSLQRIAEEWDSFAELRDEQLRTGQDLSFELVLKPTVLNLLEGADRRYVLDCGCGTGVLAEILAAQGGRVVGVDVSGESIRIARRHRGARTNIEYIESSIEEFASASTDRRFTAVVANMVLMDVPDLSSVLRSIASVLEPGGALIATITHPFFWPLYWGYADAPWFSYSKETGVSGPFAISLQPEGGPRTSHYHRPLSAYANEFTRCQLGLSDVVEPMPTGAASAMFPSPWRYPRFLALRSLRKPSPAESARE